MIRFCTMLTFFLRCTWKRLAPSIRRNNNEFESNKKEKRIFYPHVIKIFFNSFRVVFWFVAFERKLPPCDTKLSSKHSTTFHSLIPTSPSIAISPPIVFSVTTTGLASEPIHKLERIITDGVRHFGVRKKLRYSCVIFIFGQYQQKKEISGDIVLMFKFRLKVLNDCPE